MRLKARTTVDTAAQDILSLYPSASSLQASNPPPPTLTPLQLTSQIISIHAEVEESEGFTFLADHAEELGPRKEELQACWRRVVGAVELLASIVETDYQHYREAALILLLRGRLASARESMVLALAEFVAEAERIQAHSTTKVVIDEEQKNRRRSMETMSTISIPPPPYALDLG